MAEHGQSKYLSSISVYWQMMANSEGLFGLGFRLTTEVWHDKRRQWEMAPTSKPSGSTHQFNQFFSNAPV